MEPAPAQTGRAHYGPAPADSLAVLTAAEKCKKCYSCVRTCPTKAIEVHGGQADIIASKCISCGYCVPMCSQGAKQIRSSVAAVRDLLKSGRRCCAMIAPSFPAAFLEVDPLHLVGAVAACGFDAVYEVAYGADLVAYEYRHLYQALAGGADEGAPRGRPSFLISSPCPAVVSYVEKISPELVPHLVPVVSPMEAMARVIRERLVAAGEAPPAIVFIGPCVAKKDEARRLAIVDEVLTYEELTDLMREGGIDLSTVRPRDFDPPHANLGRIYPVAGGLLKAAAIDDDLLESPVMIVEGSARVTELLRVLAGYVRNRRHVVTRLFDLLFCEGCIGGPAVPNDLTFYERKKYIVAFMRRRPLIDDIEEWARANAAYLDLDLSKKFSRSKMHEQPVPEEKIREILAKTGKLVPQDELNCRACGYPSCREKAIAVHRGIAEVEMCLPYLISRLEETIDDLKESQSRLIQAEKLASMGQMAAGIAHEINNPLGIVLMYSHLLREELAESNGGQGLQDVDRIIRESERARSIVQGILNFAREKKVERSETDINALVREAARGVAAIDRSGKVHVELGLDPEMKSHSVDSSQLRQVFDNLLKNSVEVMPAGGTIRIDTSESDGQFGVTISDTGPGIDEHALPHLFTPFFTTKQVGRGTGLGLSVCYGIVKMHGGSISARNRPQGGACFEIVIRDPPPRAAAAS